jgi:hypothetical protein
MIGLRTHVATFYEHNGRVDGAGNPTYSVDNDWVPTIFNWPCELQTVSGGEDARGRQTSQTTTHVLYGEAGGAEGVTVEQRVEIAGRRYNIVSAYDEQGLNMERRVELSGDYSGG